jgi:hypothetical protein
MKKLSVVVVLLAGTVLLSACGFYTCPTYAKKPVKGAVREARI